MHVDILDFVVRVDVVVAITTRCTIMSMVSSIPRMQQLSPCHRRMLCVQTSKDASMRRDPRRRKRECRGCRSEEWLMMMTALVFISVDDGRHIVAIAVVSQIFQSIYLE